jgi:hypothetical protein
MSSHWLLRVSDGKNFVNSSKYKIWGIRTDNDKSNKGKHFIKNVKHGDILWFVTSGSNGKIIAVATYRSHNKRMFGPLIYTMSNEELGWTNQGPGWTSDTEVHYTDLFNLTTCELLTHIKGQDSIRKYKNDTCHIDLPVEYSYIFKYRNVSFEM